MSRRLTSRRAGWMLLCVGGLLLACGGNSTSESGQEGEDQHPDRSRQEISVPRRIVAIAPGITEMLFVLGLGDRVVGVGDYARWPPEVAGIPKLGGLFDSRLESIAGLDPDLAVLLPSEERLRVQLGKMGVEVLTVRSDSIADVEEMAVSIGQRCSVEEAATAFLESWRSELAPRASSKATRVLLSVTREPGRMADVLVSGPDTFLHELLDRLGATNVMADAQLSYPQVGLEEIIIRRPEVVIELQANPGDYASLARDWERLAAEASIEEACVWVVAGDHVLIPGPRVPRLYRQLDDALLACAGDSE